MKILTSISLLFCFWLETKASSIIINTKLDGYTITKTKLTSVKKECILINCIRNDYMYDDNYEGFRPFILIKIFGRPSTKGNDFKITGSVKLETYLKEVVLPQLSADMKLGFTDLSQNKRVQSINTFDSLILFNNGVYEIFQGVVCLEFFNLIDFDQLHVLQANQTVLNTKAKIIKVEEWLKDSLPIGENANYEIESSKLFLLKKENDLFTFYKYSFYDEDSPLAFYREYIYKKNVGVIAFKSKFLYRVKDEYRDEIIASDEYYYFK